eukprot:426711-Heterocapsa_arctica.AAC.1
MELPASISFPFAHMLLQSMKDPRWLRSDAAAIEAPHVDTPEPPRHVDTSSDDSSSEPHGVPTSQDWRIRWPALCSRPQSVYQSPPDVLLPWSRDPSPFDRQHSHSVTPSEFHDPRS